MTSEVANPEEQGSDLQSVRIDQIGFEIPNHCRYTLSSGLKQIRGHKTTKKSKSLHKIEEPFSQNLISDRNELLNYLEDIKYKVVQITIKAREITLFFNERILCIIYFHFEIVIFAVNTIIFKSHLYYNNKLITC